MKPECMLEECSDPSIVRGYCSRHYRRLLRFGDPRTVKRAPRFATADESFAARTKREGSCLIWTGTTSSKGYGSISADGVRKLAHRWAYERVHGPIPDGMQVDHTCHTPSCVEVAHMRLATRFENARNLNGARSDSRSGVRGLRLVHGGCWEARVWHDGKHMRKQFQPDQKELAIAWLIETRKSLFGEFAGHPGNVKKNDAA